MNKYMRERRRMAPVRYRKRQERDRKTAMQFRKYLKMSGPVRLVGGGHAHYGVIIDGGAAVMTIPKMSSRDADRGLIPPAGVSESDSIGRITGTRVILMP